MLNEALEYIGHSDTYKRDHDNELIHQRTSFSSELNHPDPDCSLDKFMTDHDNISYKLIDENKGNKTTVYANLDNSKESYTNQFMDENLKIDVPTLILNYFRKNKFIDKIINHVTFCCFLIFRMKNVTRLNHFYQICNLEEFECIMLTELRFQNQQNILLFFYRSFP